jgi:hypothetical protein
MEEWDLVKRGREWVQEGTGGQKVRRGPLKDEAVRKAAQAAKRTAQPITLKIHKTDGSFVEERTYPRKADPRKTKG